MKVVVDLERGEKTFYAGAFMDKIPLLLVGSCGTSLLADEVTRDRTEWVGGSFKTTYYKVKQPDMHDTYRRNFNAVDLFNRDCFGEHSLQMAVKTRSWSRRFFLALFGMCETNALKAYRTKWPITRHAWLCQLADKLINNPYIVEESGDDDAGDGGDAGEGPSTGRGCGNQEYMEHHLKCRSCGARCHW